MRHMAAPQHVNRWLSAMLSASQQCMQQQAISQMRCTVDVQTGNAAAAVALHPTLACHLHGTVMLWSFLQVPTWSAPWLACWQHLLFSATSCLSNQHDHHFSAAAHLVFGFDAQDCHTLGLQGQLQQQKQQHNMPSWPCQSSGCCCCCLCAQ